MNNLCTIGFTQKTAEKFFDLLKESNVKTVLDIRLNNTSQLAGFAKFPDLQYFLKKIYDIEYIHDTNFAPTESTLKRFKNKEIDWDGYVQEFTHTMNSRKIENYIAENYTNYDNICLLCSEPTAEKCHRRLIAEIFQNHYSNLKIRHL